MGNVRTYTNNGYTINTADAAIRGAENAIIKIQGRIANLKLNSHSLPIQAVTPNIK